MACWPDLYRSSSKPQTTDRTDAEKATFQEWKQAVIGVPALGLPDLTKTLELFARERKGIALGILAQYLGPSGRAVAYFSKRLGNVSLGCSGRPRAVAATVLLIQEARKFT